MLQMNVVSLGRSNDKESERQPLFMIKSLLGSCLRQNAPEPNCATVSSGKSVNHSLIKSLTLKGETR